MSPNCMPCHNKTYYLDDEGNYTEIRKITDADLTPQNDEKYDISCLAWDDQMTITFKLSWWQRVKLWFLTRRKRKWTTKRSQAESDSAEC